MAILIGVDEAGYGPNLGPLVIAATAWEVRDELTHEDLYRAAAPVVTADPPDDVDHRLWIADSKRVYRPGGEMTAIRDGLRRF